MQTDNELKEIVRQKYSEIALQDKETNESSCCGASCCSTEVYNIMSEDYTKLDGYNVEADLGLGYLPGLDTGFYQQTLFAQDWICLVNAQHPRLHSDAPGHWNLDSYQQEGHIGISAGTGYHLMDEAVNAQGVERRIRLELPGFLGLAAILSTNDLVATLPRQIGETLARAAGLRTLPCPFEIPGFTVKQYWHARYHHDPASRWLRGICAELFMRPAPDAAR